MKKRIQFKACFLKSVMLNGRKQNFQVIIYKIHCICIVANIVYTRPNEIRQTSYTTAHEHKMLPKTDLRLKTCLFRIERTKKSQAVSLFTYLARRDKNILQEKKKSSSSTTIFIQYKIRWQPRHVPPFLPIKSCEESKLYKGPKKITIYVQISRFGPSLSL